MEELTSLFAFELSSLKIGLAAEQGPARWRLQDLSSVVAWRPTRRSWESLSGLVPRLEQHLPPRWLRSCLESPSRKGLAVWKEQVAVRRWRDVPSVTAAKILYAKIILSTTPPNKRFSQ